MLRFFEGLYLLCGLTFGSLDRSCRVAFGNHCSSLHSLCCLSLGSLACLRYGSVCFSYTAARLILRRGRSQPQGLVFSPKCVDLMLHLGSVCLSAIVQLLNLACALG